MKENDNGAATFVKAMRALCGNNNTQQRPETLKQAAVLTNPYISSK